MLNEVHYIKFLSFKLFFVLRGCETIHELKMSNIKKVDSQDLNLTYYCLTNRRPDKNHANDKEDIDGLGTF